jgi:4-amino-4-deoxy-L-arabinose transferase-like glycosyltransferase
VARANSTLGLLISVLGGLAAGEWMLLDAMSRNSPQVPLLAVLCFGFAAGSLALYRGTGTAADPPARALVGQRARRAMALLAAAGLTAYVLQQLQILPGDASHLHVIAAWLLAFALYTAAVLPRRDAATRTWVGWRALWAEQQWVALAVAGILLVALFVRVWQLGSIPFVFSGDEANFGMEALRTMSGAISDPFTTGWLSQPTASFFYNSLGIYALGPTVEAVRLPWALAGAATVPVAFWLVSRLAGVPLGLVTAALLSVYHFHLHYSRLALNNIADPLFVALALLALYCALDKKSAAYWVMLGGVCGLALYFYQGARITPLIVGLVLGYLLLYGRSPFWREHRRGMAVALGAFLVSAAPMIQYAIRFPADFNARINMVSILQPGWLEADAAARGMTVPGVLLDQFQRAALAFNFFPDRAPFYGLPQPLLDPLFGAVFLLGLGYGTFRVFGKYPDKRLFPMVAWWWAGIILGGMLTESPPSSQRIVTVTVPVCFFVALGLYKLVEVIRSAALLKGQGTVVMAAGVVLFAGMSLKTYFVDFTPQRIAGGLHAEIATEILPVLRQMGPGYDAYFAGAPAMFWDFPTLHYPGDPMPGKDIVEPLTAPPPSSMVPPGRGAVFVFLPHRLPELDFVRAAFPNGTVREVYSPAQRQVIVTLYSIPPSEGATP